MESGPFTPQGTRGSKPSKCHCAEEATALLPALADAAKAKHDATGKGCGSAVSIPSLIPAGTYYVPVQGAGLDFSIGNATTGWLCLGAVMPSPIHCRYSYTKGSSPVATAHGGTAVDSPEDFEVAAEGDADGDGVASAFSVTGKIGPDGKAVIQPLSQFQPSE